MVSFFAIRIQPRVFGGRRCEQSSGDRGHPPKRYQYNDTFEEIQHARRAGKFVELTGEFVCLYSTQVVSAGGQTNSVIFFKFVCLTLTRNVQISKHCDVITVAKDLGEDRAAAACCCFAATWRDEDSESLPPPPPSPSTMNSIMLGLRGI